MSNRSKNLSVKVQDGCVFIRIDPSQPCGDLTQSGKSQIISATDGMARVKFGDRTLKVSVFMCEALSAQIRYEAEVKRVADKMVKNGVDAKLADATAREIVKAPKEKAPDAGAKAEASAAVRKGVPDAAPASETPAADTVVPPAPPSAAKGSRVRTVIHPRA